MDFNFNGGFGGGPDPDKIFQAVTRLKDAFQAAADDSRGAAKPKFEALNEAFLGTQSLDVDKISSISSILKIAGALKKFHGAMTDVTNYAKTDPDAAATLNALGTTVTSVAQELGGGMMGGLDGLGGLGGFGQTNDNTSEEKPAAPKPKAPRKKPGGGDFNL